MTIALAWLLAAPFAACGGDGPRLRDGDRVVLVGSTLVERAQATGYWETLLTALNPDLSLTFRNLGWSGDTVFGDARAAFDTPSEGYKRLVEHVAALKPTVIVVGYGSVESFEGEAGLPRFREGLDRLLGDLAKTGARLVLLSPTKHEDLGRPLPDPAAHNRDLARYRDAVRSVAESRAAAFVDLFDLPTLAGTPQTLTDNGLHLTPFGYWRTAFPFATALTTEPDRWIVELDDAGKPGKAEGVEIARVERTAAGLRFEGRSATLPPPPRPAGAPADAPLPLGGHSLIVRGLPPGDYRLTIDGDQVATFTLGRGPAIVNLDRGPEFEQAEQLRRTIVAKDRLYFDRWRPQNETYLFGFRKHEQGQNAREIPLFDPLVEAKEAEIAGLRRPRPHVYELTRNARSEANP